MALFSWQGVAAYSVRPNTHTTAFEVTIHDEISHWSNIPAGTAAGQTNSGCGQVASISYYVFTKRGISTSYCSGFKVSLMFFRWHCSAVYDIVIDQSGRVIAALDYITAFITSRTITRVLIELLQLILTMVYESPIHLLVKPQNNVVFISASLPLIFNHKFKNPT